jgi:hypothetical protein
LLRWLIICSSDSADILSESNIFFEATIVYKVTFFMRQFAEHKDSDTSITFIDSRAYP